MRLEGANEADVREDIVVPLLDALGYKRGTPNDISREVRLVYERQFLGRKKQSDLPLQGRADYVLSVTGAGRWVLETKSPKDPIDRNAIEQAMSYARHPEVGATYAVVVNGVRLIVMHVTQRSTDSPILELETCELSRLVPRLQGLLSPSAIRRDCSPPIVDIGMPLAPKLRSFATVKGGHIRHGQMTWKSKLALPPQAMEQFNELSRRLKGMLVPVTGGHVERDISSRIRARLNWSLPHDELVKFVLDKKLQEVDYIALDNRLSTDPERPTVFDVVGDVSIAAGESIFDIARWESGVAGIPTRMQYRGKGVGYVSEFIFRGIFVSHYTCTTPLMPAFEIEMEMDGDFEIELDRK